MEKVRVHDYFNPPSSPGLDCSGDEPRTQQQFKDDCDINILIARFTRGEAIPEDLLERRTAVFGDFTGIQDFQTIQDRLVALQEMFDGLPAKTRSRFSNNPGELVEFLSNPANRKEAVELGIISKAEAGISEAAAAAAVPPAAPAPAGVPPGKVADVPPAPHTTTT